MVDIVIKQPIYLEFNILEFENVLQSLKINCILKHNLLKGNFHVNFNFWVFCKDFESFGKKESSFIYDLDGIKRFSIEDDKLIINSTIDNLEVKFNSNIIVDINDEFKQVFLNKFRDFNKWW